MREPHRANRCAAAAATAAAAVAAEQAAHVGAAGVVGGVVRDESAVRGVERELPLADELAVGAVRALVDRHDEALAGDPVRVWRCTHLLMHMLSAVHSDRVGRHTLDGRDI